MPLSNKSVPAKRTLVGVLDKIIKHIPASETEFLEKLANHRREAWFPTHPAKELVHWQRTQETIIKFIPIPEEEWHYVVKAMFANIDLEAYKKMHN